MKWIIIDAEYLDYLRVIEKRIPYTHYGKKGYKPFFGPLFETDEFFYVTQVSSPKDRHLTMKENLDFYKIFYPGREQLIGVININYMLPIPKDGVRYITNYSILDELRQFSSESERSKYIQLIKKELKQLNLRDLAQPSQRLYNMKCNGIQNKFCSRCFDFTELEERAFLWKSRI